MASKGFFIGGLLEGIGKGGEHVAKSVIDRERDEAMALREENMARFRQQLEDTSWEKRNEVETATRREDASTAFDRQKDLEKFSTEERVRGEGLLTPVMLERKRGESDIETKAKKSEFFKDVFFDEKSNKWYMTNANNERVDVGVPETISRERIAQAGKIAAEQISAKARGSEVKAGEANSAKSDLSELYGFKMLEFLQTKTDAATINAMMIQSSNGDIVMPRLMAAVSELGPEGKKLVDEYVSQKDVVGQALDAGNNPLRATPAAQGLLGQQKEQRSQVDAKLKAVTPAEATSMSLTEEQAETLVRALYDAGNKPAADALAKRFAKAN